MDYNSLFAGKLANLNEDQLSAVNQIDGPLMVVAGPGTGKTELLAMRVANILRQTDILPSNILCLTFTEAAAANMTDRLSGIIGPDAYKVEINTFHGFGSKIISQYNNYFYNGADFKAASPLTQSEIINGLIAKLPFGSPLRSEMEDKFVYLSPLVGIIRDLKKSAIEPDEARILLKQNLDFCQQIKPQLNQTFIERIGKGSIDKAQDLLDQARQISEQQDVLAFTDEPSLATVFSDQLESVLRECMLDNNKVITTPLTKFKGEWTEHDKDSAYMLKEEKISNKLLEAIDIYEQYLETMQQRGLYDFSDMILNVIKAMKANPDLKADLQEKYQYILVDEFQDTNDAQMKLLDYLTDYDDSPNLMVVGDDDQAIYRFQGADISNIQTFAKRFKNLKQVNLKINYRSGEDILLASQQVASGIDSRLTNYDGSNKELIAGKATPAKVNSYLATTAEHEYYYVATSIKSLIDQGEGPANIAVIGRQHSDLEQLSLYLAKYDIPINYERKRDIFYSELVNLVIMIAQTIHFIAEGSINLTNQYLPEILANQAFGLSDEDFYQISLASHRGSAWLDLMDKHSDQTKAISDWLKHLAKLSTIESLRRMIDEIIGLTKVSDTEIIESDNAIDDKSKNYISPIFAYYLDNRKLQDNSLRYLSLLNDLNTLLASLTEFKPDQELKLVDMLDFVEKSHKLSQKVYSTVNYGGQSGVNLMSAHKAKGLEFRTVFIINSTSNEWGGKKSGRPSLLKFPINMPFGIAGENNDDEKRRLLFVAMTRAQNNLVITSHRYNANNKELIKLEYIMDAVETTELDPPTTLQAIDSLSTSYVVQMARSSQNQKQLLINRLDRYKLSATDLNTFTDVVYGGPERFLIYNLLRVPSKVSGTLIFGNAIHATMQRIHNYMNLNGSLLAIDEVMKEFNKQFDGSDLDPDEAKAYLDKGAYILEEFYSQRGQFFNNNQLAEQHLTAVIDGDIQLTGKIDSMEINRLNHTIKVVDYKTGKPVGEINRLTKNDNDSIKARHYKQQLLFYKLLIENSAEYSDYRVIEGNIEFIEPNANGEIICPRVDYDDKQSLEEFHRLLRSVWNHIITLNLPDIDQYKKDYKGIVAFEDYLSQGEGYLG